MHLNLRLRLLPAFAMACGLTLAGADLWCRAQEEGEKKEPPKKAAASPKKKGKEAPPPTLFDESVQAVLASSPKTPPELMQAVRVLVGLKHPQYAKQYVQLLIAANLDEAGLAALVEKFGSGAFLEMMVTPELQPDGKQFGDAALAAARKVSTDPEHLNKLVAELENPAADVRHTATLRMRAAGSAAAAPLIAVLADPAKAALHPYARTALVAQGRPVMWPLIGALGTPDPKLKAQIVECLARLNEDQAAPFVIFPALDPKGDADVKKMAQMATKQLFGKTPSLQEAVFLLGRKAEAYFERLVPIDPDLEGQVDIWSWNDEQKASVATRVPADAGSAHFAALLAGDAYRLSPQDLKARRFYLTTLFEEAALKAGLDAAADPRALEEAKRLGPDAVLDVLVQALPSNHAPAAAAAATLLGEIGTAELLHNRPGRFSALVEAAVHKDRRVRIAALETILKLKPSGPYPGSSDVLASLGFLISNTGAPRAVVVDPRISEARRLGGLLTEAGFEVEVTNNGRELNRLATRQSDCELALVSADLGRIEMELTLRQLRQDPRTANLPIGLVGSPGEELLLARRFAVGDPLTGEVVRPDNAKDMQFQTNLLLGRLGRAANTPEVRQAQTNKALALVVELAKQQGALRDARRAHLADSKNEVPAELIAAGIYDFARLEKALFLALQVPALAPAAAEALGQAGAPHAQRALVQMANVGATNLEQRTAAAKAFAESVKRWGTLLTTVEIERQYDLYNNSVATKTPGSEEVLAVILDAIEERGGAVKTPAGEDVPPPPAN